MTGDGVGETAGTGRAKATEAADRSAGRKKRVLIIDGAHQVRDGVRMMLKREGYEIDEAADGREAISLCRGHLPDLIIAGFAMPGTEGIETVLELRKMAPQAKIIAVPGGGQPDAAGLVRLAESFDVDATFKRPVDGREFRDLMRILMLLDSVESSDPDAPDGH